MKNILKNKFFWIAMIIIALLIGFKGCDTISIYTKDNFNFGENRMRSGYNSDYIDLIIDEGRIVEYVDFECMDDCDAEDDVCYDTCEDTCMGIGMGCDMCFDACDDEIFECYDTCIVFAEDEVYEWDGSNINNIGSFYQNGFPFFYEVSRTICWFMGDWVEDENQIGCEEMGWFTPIACSSESVQSAGVVCETIGWDYECNEDLEYVKCN